MLDGPGTGHRDGHHIHWGDSDPQTPPNLHMIAGRQQRRLLTYLVWWRQCVGRVQMIIVSKLASLYSYQILHEQHLSLSLCFWWVVHNGSEAWTTGNL